MDRLIVVDSVELEMAELAAKRTQNTAVRDYANMLISDHRGHLESLRKIASEDDVGRQASASDTAGAVAIRSLTSLAQMSADSGFDKAFLREQIRLHNQEIIALKMFGGAAKDDDLKDEVKRTMPLLERPLARTRGRGTDRGAHRFSRYDPAAHDDLQTAALNGSSRQRL